MRDKVNLITNYLRCVSTVFVVSIESFSLCCSKMITNNNTEEDDLRTNVFS